MGLKKNFIHLRVCKSTSQYLSKLYHYARVLIIILIYVIHQIKPDILLIIKDTGMTVLSDLDHLM